MGCGKKSFEPSEIRTTARTRREYRRSGKTPTPQAPEETAAKMPPKRTTRIACGTIDERRKRYIRQIVIIESEVLLFPPFILWSETEQEKQAACNDTKLETFGGR